jgi:hypothetical protein
MRKWSNQSDLTTPDEVAGTSTERLLVPQQPDETSFSPTILGGVKSRKPRPDHLMRDPRREAAQTEAKARWASWAKNKAL